jgi:DNA-directed RNA polymerase sigma subunit (sigma70/sigma32)
MTAIDKFNPEMGFKFSTPAANWIKQGIEEHIGSNQTIKVPPYMNAIHKDILYAKTALRDSGLDDDEITDERILEWLNDPIRNRKRTQTDLDNAKKFRVETVSMELSQGEDGSTRTLGDVLPDIHDVEEDAFSSEQDDTGFEKLLAFVKNEERRNILRDIYTSPNEQDASVISNLSRKYGMTTSAFKKARREAEEEIKQALLALGMHGTNVSL